MDQVEGGFGQVVLEDVMPDDLRVRPAHQGRLDEARVEVGRRHAPRRPDALAQPAGDRPAAGADLQALPADSDPERSQVPERPGVE